MFNPTGLEVAKATGASLGIGLIVGFAGAGFIQVVQVVSAPSIILRLVVMFTPVVAAWMIGEAAYKTSGHKQNIKLQLVAGLSVFVSYLTLSTFLGGQSMQAMLGLAAGVWIATSRLKPPRGS